MKLLVLSFVLVFFTACSLKPGGTIKETVVKEPTIINNEKTVYVEVEKERCPEVKECPVCERPKPCRTIIRYKEYKRPVLGGVEEVYLPVHGLLLKARIDTGATTNSIHAENIIPFERDGRKWVRFDLKGNDNKPVQIKRPIVRMIRIKRHGKEGQERYVVNLRLNIASLSVFSEVSLTDRGQYKYPVLIGRNYLKGNVLVDVSKKYTRSPKREKE